MAVVLVIPKLPPAINKRIRSRRLNARKFGPMGGTPFGSASGFVSVAQFAAQFQSLTANAIAAVANDKLISDAHPELYIPTLAQLFSRIGI